MVAKIYNQIHVSQPSEELLSWCKQNLVLKNPEYAKKVRMGFWVGNTPKEISLYTQDGNDLILPYGCLNQVLSHAPEEIVTEFRDPETIDFQASVPLYDYQEQAVAEMQTEVCGILQSPAGSGKTQMGIALAIALQRKTLWLCHTKDLLNQSKERAEQFMSPSLTGTITEGKVHIGKGITFATVQTMCNLNLDLYRDVWDCIIVDEVHRVAGSATSVTQFSKVLNSLAARRKYGLSATVHRADGMIAATFALVGPVIYRVPEEAVESKIMRAKIEVVPTGVVTSPEFLDTDGTLVYSKLLSYLATNEDRNYLIETKLIENQEHFNLILSDRLSNLQEIMAMLPYELRQKSALIDGKMTTKAGKAQREKAISDMREGKLNFLFATYRLAKEGLDIPRLDRLHLVSPQKDYAIITQSVGRVQRTFDGKSQPIVYDYVDNIRFLVKMFKKRCTTYRKLKCEIGG